MADTKMLIIELPSGGVSHVFPVKPLPQIHSAIPLLFAHPPLFWQGFGSQGSCEQCILINRMIITAVLNGKYY